MFTISQALGVALQPILISVVTVAVLALVRLFSPAVRWNRRLKRDGQIYAALPDGKEKALWAASVTAQGERLRLYREDLSIVDQVFAWYAFFALITGAAALIWEAAHGWKYADELTQGGIWTAIPGVLLLVINLAFALFVTVRLVLGRSTALRAGTGGHYPKYDALRRAERKRKERRSAIEERLSRVQAKEKEGAESSPS